MTPSSVAFSIVTTLLIAATMYGVYRLGQRWAEKQSIRPVIEKVRAVVSMRSHLTIVALLLPLYAGLFTTIYWLWFDNVSPLTVEYAHPLFLSRPAQTKAEAVAAQITEGKSGQEVWAYREVCMSRTMSGDGRPRWESGSFSWGAPTRTFQL